MMPDYKTATQKALGILKDFQIYEPPVNPLKIANCLGIGVSYVKFTDPVDDKISGYYDAAENKIFVNSNEHVLRAIFTIAHEIGHSVLHSDWARSNDYHALMRDSTIEYDPIEKEANTFAANLLVPRFMLDQYFEELSTANLSRLFCVSVPVIKNRLYFEYGIN